MDTAVALVAFVLVTQLFVGLAHALLRGEAERFPEQDAFTFLDAFVKLALLEQDLGTDQHAGNVPGIKLQAGIHAGKRIVHVTRHELVVGKPGESHGLGLLLAYCLFQGIQCNGHLSLQGKQNRFVRQKNRNAFTNDVGPGARLVHEDLGQCFRNLFAGGILEQTRGNSLIQARKERFIRHLELTPRFGAAQNIQKFIIEHKAFIVNNLD